MAGNSQGTRHKSTTLRRTPTKPPRTAVRIGFYMSIDSDADPDPHVRAIISPHKLHLVRLLGDIVSPVFDFHSKFREEY